MNYEQFYLNFFIFGYGVLQSCKPLLIYTAKYNTLVVTELTQFFFLTQSKISKISDDNNVKQLSLHKITWRSFSEIPHYKLAHDFLPKYYSSIK